MRSCPDCDKIIRTLSGLSRHQYKCPVRNGRTRRKVLWDDASASQASLLLQHNEVEQHFDIPEGPDQSIDAFGLVYGEDEGDWEDVDESIIGPKETISPFHQAHGRLSTAASIRIETYEEVTGHKAGEPIGGQPYTTSKKRAGDAQANKSAYSPFSNSTDFALAQWFLTAACTKGDIDRFFNDPRLAPIRQLLSFSSYDELMTQIHNIPFGIQHDSWKVKQVEVGQDIIGIKPSQYQIRYRDVEQVVKFLLGHRPFANHLSYAPVRQFNSASKYENQMYSEMHTADWWWNMQTKLPENATVVPLLLSTDKTMLTQHHGDESAWPVYLTIGNLDRATRRKQTVPGSVLLGFLPITLEVGDNSKARVYHAVMELILKPFETLARDGFPITCADGYIRKCYPIIAGFMTDYEEQVLLTGIKKAQHCSICTVPPNERENLSKRWPDRTHEDTQRQIELQRSNKVGKTDDNWVHEVDNFAWNHPYLNIHKAMMIDILHQLLKGIAMYLINWTKDLIAKCIPAMRKRKRQSRTIHESSGVVQLDARFSKVPPFTGLKRFQKFSHIKQWTGVEQKALLRQLIPVIAPLLSAKEPAAMHCARAIVDFILMAQYKTHDTETLRYMEHALYRIDKMKVAFRALRPLDKTTEEGHFNFPKFHVMAHYTSYIKEFGPADNFDTEHTEAGHRYHVKDFYGRTNKRVGYEDQICLHNTRRNNMLAMETVLLYDQSKHTTQCSDHMKAQVSFPAREIHLTRLGWTVELELRHPIVSQGLDPHYWRTASEMTRRIGVDGFLEALAVFVRGRRNQLDNVTTTDASIVRREAYPSWAAGLAVALHPSLRCWRRKGNDSNDLELLTTELVRCKPAWQGGTEWRRDYVWVQEHDPTSKSPLDGKLVGQIQAIVSVIDNARRNANGRPVRYTGAFIELLRLRNNGQPHKIHGMVEVEDWPFVQAKNPRNLGHRRFFDMTTILRSAHIVPAGSNGIYYINNYIDWDQYNTLYSPDFLEEGIRDADQIEAQYQNF